MNFWDKPMGDGFTESDRARHIRVEEKVGSNSGKLIRIEEKLIATIEANTKLHKDSEKKCEEIKDAAEAAHRRVDDMEICIAKKQGFFMGQKGTLAVIGTIVGTVTALAIAGWAAWKAS